jgi:N-acetylmuramoyl-L-alanine amidase
MEKFLICLDNGHGLGSPKGSPDGKIKEWKYTREVVNILAANLQSMGYEVYKVTPEDTDISLKERVRRVNAQCKKYGSKNTLLVSIHLNAAGNGGGWLKARGFSAHISPNASSRSKKLAKMLWEEALKNDMRGNRCVPNEKYIVQNLAMCRDTNCCAVLTENLFQDNKEDVERLLTVEGLQSIVRVHIAAIERYILEA